jgi:hypothetical protein
MNEQPAFQLPDHTEVANLLIGRMGETTLKPDSPVYCINRGRKVIKSTYDANHIEIPPGPFEMEYHAALHIQRREIVPGTRNLEVGGFISWIGIYGSTDGRVAVDPPELCVPFTDEELTTFGEAVEAIDRKAMSGADADVQLFRTSHARAMSRSQGVGGLRPQIDSNVQGSESAREAAAHVFDPPTEPLATRQDERAAASETFAAGTQRAEPATADDGPSPQPRPMKRPGRA